MERKRGRKRRKMRKRIRGRESGFKAGLQYVKVCMIHRRITLRRKAGRKRKREINLIKVAYTDNS